MARTRQATPSCLWCGWTFTVHGIPCTPEYKGATWFCPHCGKSTATSPSQKVTDEQRVEAVVQTLPDPKAVDDYIVVMEAINHEVNKRMRIFENEGEADDIDWTALGKLARQASLDAHGELWDVRDVYSHVLANAEAFSLGDEWPADMPQEPNIEFIAAYYKVGE